MDSGATHHLTSDLNNLALHQPYNGGEEVTIADGSGLPISHSGSALLPTPTRSLALKDVLYVLDIQKNLISVYRMCNTNGVSVEFFPAHFQVKDLSTGARLLQGKTKNELYEWPVNSSIATSMFASPTPKTDLPSWHARLGHPSLPILKALISKFSLPISHSLQNQLLCSDCSINKSHKLPFYSNTIASSHPLEYLYTDVWTSPITSIDNYKYYLVIVDHYTRYTWLYPLRKKSQVREMFITFTALVENKFKFKIGTLYSDNGGEFIAMRSFLASHGISHMTTPPHTPELNGISERKHRHIVETGLTLLSTASMPKEYWSYAFATAVYLINRMLTPVLGNESPYVKLFGQPPNYLKLRIFGCLCFPWLRPYTAHKLDNRSVPCVLLGYSLSQSAYLCLDRATGRVYTSRHVQFAESSFPFLTTSPSVTPPSDPPLSQDTRPVSVPLLARPLTTAPPSSPSCSAPHRSLSQSENLSPPAPLQPSLSLSPTSPITSPSLSEESLVGHNSETGPTGSSPPLSPQPQRPQPQSPQSTSPHSSSPQPNSPNPQHSPRSLTPTLTSSPSPSPPPNPNPPPIQHTMRTRSKNNIVKPNPKFANLATKPTPLKPIIPKTVVEALLDPNWRQAMCDEINAQTRNGTFDLVPPAPNQNVVGCKWVFTLKYLSNGVLDRYKARLVAKGFHQQYGHDFKETFSPVIKSTTVRSVLHVAVSKGWSIRQIDVNNAFLQGTLSDEVYVTQPPGFVDKDNAHHVCRLYKALYGLKQAPRAWYQELRSYLLTQGFVNSVADTSLFTLRHERTILYVLVYVDDMLITGSDTNIITRFIANLAARFSLKDLGEMSYFLGIEATRTSKGLHLMQKRYVLDLLEKTNMLAAHPVLTPMSLTPKLSLTSGKPLDKPSEYRAVLGSLQYLSFTRPDIAYAVNRLSQYMHCPTDLHWQAAKRILQYLAGTPSHGIFIRADTPLTLHAYSDADWAGDIDNYNSTNAYILYLGSNPISWSSKKQKGVARSSTEAEYRAVANATSEIRWVCSLLTELGITLSLPPVVYCDNVGATYLSANPVFDSRMKHIALDFHFVRESVQAGALRVTHVSTKDQLADALTKPLPRQPFTTLISKIGVAKAPPS